MLSSGIEFRVPIIPNENSLKDVPTSSSLEKSNVSNIEPNFPPLTYTQIINVIKNDMADAITLSEWLMLFCNDIYIDNELEKQEISILLWKCINNYDAVANMAFFLASQFIEKERKSYPVLLLDTLSIVKPFLHERHHRRVEWLTNIYKADYISCNKLALANNSQTLCFINKLKLAKPNATRKGLINNLINSLPKTLDTISSEWLISSFSPLTRFELLSVINELVQSHIQFSNILDTWIKENCLPSEEQSLWYELEPASRKVLEEKYEISNYFLFELLVKLLSKDANSSALNIDDIQSNQLKARSVFWKNYSQKFNQIKILLPKHTYQVTSEGLVVNSRNLIILPDEPNENSEACIFEIGEYIIVEILRGQASEIRVFERSQRNIARLLENKNLSLKDIRNMTYGYVHDHEYLWQFAFEKLLRTKLTITPNSNITHFLGLPKSIGRYDHQYGMAKPSEENLMKRQSRLIEWNERFWNEEEKTEKYSGISPLVKKSYRDLAIAKNALLDGNKHVYETYLHKSANKGNPEAMYLLGVNIINNPKSSSSLKRDGENWVIKAAISGHPPAVELAERYNLQVTDGYDVNVRVSQNKNLISSINSGRRKRAN
ncbi:EH signature domain-containing protein [Pseudoalteromonas sp. SR45-4]|uniref:EH signature domain-containing protein n=1 Tax=Pseudoalteromonas sp. SR45-4 TaxID=2760929 RepID=UPI0015F9AD53|nr:EH signature domain-containing protein [Pseudoalteromonas sp. SR45-4]MBB1370651.1 hypothetical protein [Pseudoalteromonas sp. SR45-4]